MQYVLLGALGLLVSLAAYQGFWRLSPATRAKLLRWGLGGGAAALTVLLAFWRRFDLAFFTGVAAFTIFRFGRIGRFTIGGGKAPGGNVSEVHSRYFDMALDHTSGAVAGRVIDGAFAGADLSDLGEDETRRLLSEVSADPDSLRLLESWLDANRAGWRDYFAESEAATAAPPPGGMTSVEEAWAVLGLSPNASDDDIRRAHRDLMKGLHPDHGGSSYLAAKLNLARDLLLKRRR